MKKYITTGFLLSALFLLASCKKDNPADLTNNDGSLFMTSAAPAATAKNVAPTSASFLGSAANYAVLGLSNTYVNLSNVTINNGPVGVGPAGSINFAAPTTVNGNLYLNNGVSATVHGHLSGSVYSNQNLATAMSDAITASNTAAALAPTVTVGNLSGALTVQGNGSLNVISINNLNLNNGGNITLNGNSNDFFIINVTGSFAMSGSAKITTSANVVSSHVIINIIGTGTTATSNITNLINGTILATQRSVTLHSVSGQVICGGAQLTLMSSATVNYVPYVS